MQIVRHVRIYRDRVYQICVRLLTEDRARRYGGAEEHGENVHKNNSGKIEDIKPKRAHAKLHMPPEHIEKVQKDQSQKTVGRLGEYIGNQSPNLSLQDQRLIEAQKIKKGSATVKKGKSQDNGIANHDIEHQIGDALVAVSV